MGAYTEALSGLSKLEGVKGAYLMTQEGEVLESAASTGTDMGKLVALAVKSLETSGLLAGHFGKGSVGQNYVEYKDFNITLDAFSGSRLLIVVAAAGTNLGRIRYEIKKTKQLVEGMSG